MIVLGDPDRGWENPHTSSKRWDYKGGRVKSRIIKKKEEGERNNKEKKAPNLTKASSESSTTGIQRKRAR